MQEQKTINKGIDRDVVDRPDAVHGGCSQWMPFGWLFAAIAFYDTNRVIGSAGKPALGEPTA